jgi:hypothetical protein
MAKSNIHIYQCNVLKVTTLGFLLLLFSCEQRKASTVDQINFDKIVGNNIILSNKLIINTELYDVTYICSLKRNKQLPFLVVSARECKECDANLSIYVIQIDSTRKLRHFSYSYPGKEYDYTGETILFESEFFFSDKVDSNNLMWIQKQYSTDKKVDSSVFIVDVQEDTLHEKRIKFDNFHKIPNINYYKHLDGIDVSSEP